MFRNNFLALKVSFCNEIEELCRKLNITYENVRLLAVLDDRIGKSIVLFLVMMVIVDMEEHVFQKIQIVYII